MASDWDKVLAGGALNSQSEEIANDRIRGQALLARLNATPAGDHQGRQSLCAELFGHCPDSCWISSPFICEFGRNIHLGEKTFFNFNVTKAPFDNPQVREALSLAISRDEHLALYGEPVAENVFSVVPEVFMPGGLTREEAEAAGVALDQDVERAKQLLAEAGVEGLSIDLITSEMPAYRSNYEVLQAELADVGVTVNLNVVDHATMHEQIRQDVNPITLYVAFRPNADVYLTQFFFSESAVVEGASPVTNFSHYSAIDDLILQARGETDAETQDELWKQANIQILKDVAAMPLHYQNQVYARSPKQIAAAVETLLEHQQLTLQDEDVVAAALVRFRRLPRLGFSDCLMLEVARKAGHLPFGTFDRALSRLDGATRVD